MPPLAEKINISANWQWKQRNLAINDILSDAGDDKDWTDCVSFPSEVHVELIRSGKIPDPYLGFNEHKVQCELHCCRLGRRLLRYRMQGLASGSGCIGQFLIAKLRRQEERSHSRDLIHFARYTW